jgi:hypothetical protein
VRKRGSSRKVKSQATDMFAVPYSALPLASPSFAEDFCIPWLLGVRNADGGWGYRPNSTSAVEPTCWALLALMRRSPVASGQSHDAWAETEEDWRLPTEWLRRTQLRDGSWPSFAGQPKGCWVTALASQTLRGEKQSAESVARGVRWLCETWPAEWGFWRRLYFGLRPDANVSRQNSSLRGWSWTPGTASWVEPTSHALLLLKSLGEDMLPRSAGKRKRLAEAMLYDRMCPGGGWNAGNPVVYNVAGIPRVGPTAWALLAMQDQRERSEIGLSVNWLASVYADIQGPGSLALAYLSLKAHGKDVASAQPALRSQLQANECLMNVAVMAWVTMALTANLVL